jgi:hypothetical protein
MEDTGIFYDHLVCFIAILYILWPFGTFYGYLVYFSPFWYVVPRRIWQPWSRICKSFSALIAIKPLKTIKPLNHCH